jgi:hypothetical protein
MKLKIALIVASATALLASAVSGYADETSEDKDSDAVRARIGFDNAPVPLNLKGRDRFLVGLGVARPSEYDRPRSASYLRVSKCDSVPGRIRG